MNQTINWRSKFFSEKKFKTEADENCFRIPLCWLAIILLCIASRLGRSTGDLHFTLRMVIGSPPLCQKCTFFLLFPLSFEPTDCVFQPIENWALYEIMFAAMYMKQCQRFIFSLALSLVSHSKGYVGTLCPLLPRSNSLEHDGLLLMVMVMISPADSASAASAGHPTVVSTPHQSTSTSTWSKDPISELLWIMNFFRAGRMVNTPSLHSTSFPVPLYHPRAKSHFSHLTDVAPIIILQCPPAPIWALLPLSLSLGQIPPESSPPPSSTPNRASSSPENFSQSLW